MVGRTAQPCSTLLPFLQLVFFKDPKAEKVDGFSEQSREVFFQPDGMPCGRGEEMIHHADTPAHASLKRVATRVVREIGL